MKKERWELWINNKRSLEKDFDNYLRKRIIKKGATELEVNGHLNKAKRNLRFAKRIIDEFKDYYEWSIIAYYYAVYHSALSLCANKGFKTKRHLATIAILVKFYYPADISKDDLKRIAEMPVLAEGDIREFVELKNYREDASYGISVSYEKSLVEDLGRHAIDFVNKAEKIIKAGK